MHTVLPRAPLVLLLHDLRSAYNTGSIFRTADAMHIEMVLLSGFTPDPTHPRIRKTALGAEKVVPWARVEDPLLEITERRSRGYTIAALERAPASIDLVDARSSHFPLVLIAGNEVDGVPAHLLEASTTVFEITQLGMKQSLNVSVAVGIALHSLVHYHRSSNTLNS